MNQRSRKMLTSIRLSCHFMTLVAVFLATIPRIAVAVQADATPVGFVASGSISLQVFTCPESMNRDTLVVNECVVATDEFAIEIHQSSVAQPRTLTDATFNGAAYVWSGLQVAPTSDSGVGDPSYYAIVESKQPPGYTDYFVTGADARGDKDALETHFSVRLFADIRNISLAVYNFVDPPPTIEPATVTVFAAVCPSGFRADNHAAFEQACEYMPTPDVWFRSARPGHARLLSHVVAVEQSNAEGIVEFAFQRTLLQGQVYVSVDLSNNGQNEEIVDLLAITEIELFCVDDTDQPVDSSIIAFTQGQSAVAAITVAPGDAIRCDWFFVWNGHG